MTDVVDGPEANSAGSAQEIRDKHQQYMLPAVANYYADPVVLDSGKGLRLKDVDGREYLDFFGGILTVSIGHCDDRVTAPVKAQIDRLGHVSSLYPTAPVVELAERLAKITPGRLEKSIFTASGTDADDTAVILAQVFTQSLEIIALRHGYSGRGTLAQALTGHAPWRAVPAQVASVRHAVSPYCYRCPFGQTYPECNVQCARDVEELIATTTTGKVAAFLAEPIQGVGGFIVPPPEYFQIVVDIVRKHGGVFICDEVQTGFGRTGGKMFGIEHWGVDPEIMTMAKGIANGM
ncbi:MAG: aminotransferase class III-fold pyridoxal phosphate-dependent enzyme, partial [Planctomycetota bacterium]|nr:aminotransferase class III-fold pyridoxal phosphate-dependent enzyme [Planctomycetota bacterium]